MMTTVLVSYWSIDTCQLYQEVSKMYWLIASSGLVTPDLYRSPVRGGGIGVGLVIVQCKPHLKQREEASSL